MCHTASGPRSVPKPKYGRIHGLRPAYAGYGYLIQYDVMRCAAGLTGLADVPTGQHRLALWPMWPAATGLRYATAVDLRSNK